MTVRKYTSRSQQTTLSASVTSGATTIVVNSANALLSGIGNISGGPTFTVVIDPDTTLEEIVDVTAYTVNNNTLTITRGVDGSSPQDHSAGAIVRHMIIGRDLRESNTHQEASAGVHGLAVTSSVVGTIDAQDLSNKNIDMTGKTLTGLSSAGMVASSATPKNYVDAILGSATAAATSATSAATSASSAATSASSAATSASSAATSASSALTSQTAAATSATSAAASATAAATSATSAAASATTASNSATTATTQAANASTSASSAATSASSAATSQSAAATSASSASTSASSAATSATAAASSATAAASSATAAASSATAAATSATSAAASATAASTSATSAAASASAASTSASSAATSATAAASSATAAATSATSAAASATTAASSATAAATSASSAATSATAAASSATAAASSATAAASSATAAATSATSAAASASAASTSASSAATSASSAATSATAAASSATAAATSATSAATSATSAATSASSASTTYDAYDQRYLGSKSTAPTVDNKGNTLITGATYWNTTTTTMYVWSGSAWQAISNASAVTSVLAGTGITVTGTTAPTVAIDTTVVPRLSTANTFSGAQTANSFIPSSSTVPTNGMYLPAANTLGFATNSAVAMQISSSGYVSTAGTLGVGEGIGSASAVLQIGNARTLDGNAYVDFVADATTYTDYGFRILRGSGANGATSITQRGTGALQLVTNEAASITFGTSATTRMTIDSSGRVGIGTINSSTTFTTSKSMTGATVIYGILNNGTIASDVTSVARYYSSNPATVASAFTISEVSSFYANSVSIGATSTVTNQYGFIAAVLSGATNNYSFVAQSNAASNVWNFYAVGTAANYFAGQTTVGSTLLTLGSSSAAQQFGVVSTAAANVGIVVRGAASQTGNLTEWQNSAGTVLSQINSAGSLELNGKDIELMTLMGAF